MNSSSSGGRFAGRGVLVVLLASAGALVVAPSVVPRSYSWVEHSTSESAAQGIDGAWVARLGFVLLGLAVLWLATVSSRRWGSAGTGFHRCFGVAMIAVAAFAARPWVVGSPFDGTEDTLHSVGSFAAGLGFIAGVVAVSLVRPGRPAARILDVAAVVVAVGASIAMTMADDVEGALQRANFLAAYVWYAREALAVATSDRVAPPRAQAHDGDAPARDPALVGR